MSGFARSNRAADAQRRNRAADNRGRGPTRADEVTPDSAAGHGALPGFGNSGVLDALAAQSGRPLDAALSKVDQVAYVDPVHGQGDGQRAFTREEIGALKSGSGDMEAASCSPFMYWTLAASGIDVNAPIDGALGSDGEPLSIRAILNNEASLYGAGETMGGLARADDDKAKGAAHAFELAGIGAEVEPEHALPGDFVQTYSEAAKKRDWAGGHATMVHRSHAVGAAIFGQEGSPELVGGPPETTGALGFDGAPARFRVDEDTDPELVGPHTVEQVELIGAHLPGLDSDGNEHEAGVYTKAPVSLDDYFRAYVARLSGSEWSAWTPAAPVKTSS